MTLRQNLGQISEENKTISDGLRQAANRIFSTGETISGVLSGLKAISEHLADVSKRQDQLATHLSQVALRQVEVAESTQQKLHIDAELTGSFRDAVNAMTAELLHARRMFAEFEQRSAYYLARTEGQAAPRQPSQPSVVWRVIAVSFGILTVIELGSILFLILKVATK
jgi:methyl-accepting chemotaxis protein